MKSTPITDNSIQLTRMGWVNCYLVLESDGFTLIDSTLGGAQKDILAAAATAGAPIRRILLTHAHTDHVGSVDTLLDLLPAAQLAASARSLPLLQKPANKSLEPGEPAGKIKGGLPGIRATPSHLIADGELYGSLRCIATPGHIPGHFSFLDERDGTLFAGDALLTIGKLAISGYGPWYFPPPNLLTWNKPTALASARKLLNFPIQRFASGHGRIREGGIPLLRSTIEKAS